MDRIKVAKAVTVLLIKMSVSGRRLRKFKPILGGQPFQEKLLIEAYLRLLRLNGRAHANSARNVLR